MAWLPRKTPHSPTACGRQTFVGRPGVFDALGVFNGIVHMATRDDVTLAFDSFGKAVQPNQQCRADGIGNAGLIQKFTKSKSYNIGGGIGGIERACDRPADTLFAM